MSHGIQQAYEEVKAFHLKHGFTIEMPLEVCKLAPKQESRLRSAANVVDMVSKRLEHECNKSFSLQLLRAHLNLEEPAESLLAMAEGDRKKLLDALADSLYVIIGCAVTFGLPIAEAFKEVHRSNMTKAARKKGDLRLRDKGESYSPPDMAKVIAEHEAKRRP